MPVRNLDQFENILDKIRRLAFHSRWDTRCIQTACKPGEVRNSSNLLFVAGSRSIPALISSMYDKIYFSSLRSAYKTVERYLSPKDGMITTIFLPLNSSRFATFAAAHRAAPEERPARIPSSTPARRA